MQVGVQDQVLAEVLVLGLQGLLDFDDHVSGPSLSSGLNDLAAGSNVLSIGEGGADTGVLLNQDSVTSLDILAGSIGGQTHAELVVLDFLSDTNNHKKVIFLSNVF